MALFNKKTVIEPSLCQTIVLGGEAGEGIKSAGKIIANVLLESGYDVFLTDEYPSVVRGGHNAVMITYSPYPVYAINREIDILVCIDRTTFLEHKENLALGSTIIYDSTVFQISNDELFELPAELIDLALTKEHSKNKLPRIILNTLYIAATLQILGFEKEITKEIFTKIFSKKKSTLEDNFKAIDIAYLEAEEFAGQKKHPDFKKAKKTKNSYFMSGNDAVSIGAIRSDLGFYAAYPMTPASTILDFMSAHFREYNLIVKQTEDELSAINMAIGASFAGQRSMVGTSGGGFSLMVEGLGLAAITETPIVIVVSQRPGPATGLPTWTGQSDLQFALHASQDEFPRIILTPTDAEECITAGFDALNLADKFQVPVLILLDKYLSESYSKFNFKLKPVKIEKGLVLSDRALSRIDNFKRYEFTASGISPRSFPGQEGGIFISNSDESDEKGFSDESKENRIKKVDKRFRKISQIMKAMPDLNIYGEIKAKVSIITWGSTKGPALEAIRRLQNSGITTKLLALNYVEPFPEEEITRFIKTSKNILLVEGNYTSQLGELISQHTGFNLKNKFLKYDGRPIFPDEIVNAVLNIK